jgi:hypothetical protein
MHWMDGSGGVGDVRRDWVVEEEEAIPFFPQAAGPLH